MRNYEIRFNPSNQKVAQLLREIGFSDAQIAGGKIDQSNYDYTKFKLLAPLAKIGNKEEPPVQMSLGDAFMAGFEGNLACNAQTCFDELTPAEVAKFNVNKHRQLLIDILKASKPKYETGRIFGNLIGFEFVDYDIAGAEHPFDSYKHLPIEGLKAIHFTDQNVPPQIAAFGKSVLQVTYFDTPALFDESGNAIVRLSEEKGRGSCVVTSSEGDITSAYHVFYDEKGVFKNPSIRHPNGQLIKVLESDVVQRDAALDIIKLKLPSFANLPSLKLPHPSTKKKSPKKTAVWIIGYPPSFMPKEQDSRFYTIGTLSSIDAKGKTVTVNAGARPGYSGGAMIDQDGNLLGIVSRVEGSTTLINKAMGAYHVQRTVGRIP